MSRPVVWRTPACFARRDGACLNARVDGPASHTQTGVHLGYAVIVKGLRGRVDIRGVVPIGLVGQGHGGID